MSDTIRELRSLVALHGEQEEIDALDALFAIVEAAREAVRNADEATRRSTGNIPILYAPFARLRSAIARLEDGK